LIVLIVGVAARARSDHTALGSLHRPAATVETRAEPTLVDSIPH
jgi:hypothetical protein